MKNTEIIGLISGIFVIISIIPYVARVCQGKIKPNIVSWSLWALIGFALLLTYKSSGAQGNIWPAVFGFTNPLLVAILVVVKKGKFGKMVRSEIYCFVIGIASLVMWFFVNENKNLAQYALYIAILADVCAAIPTISFVWRNPADDRPFAWGLFAVAYGAAIFAVTEHTVANYILPAYMFLGSFSITLPLILYRIKKGVPLKEWI